MTIGVIAEAPTRSVPTRATKLSAGSAVRCLANAIGGARVPAGAEHALVEALDRLGIAVRRRLQDEGEIVHRARFSTLARGRENSSRARLGQAPDQHCGSRQARSNGSRQAWGAIS